jgi:hypothetical protein
MKFKNKHTVINNLVSLYNIALQRGEKKEPCLVTEAEPCAGTGKN